MYIDETTTIICIFAIAISILIFLLCREIICWYFKFNEMLKVQKEILNCLKEQKTESKIYKNTGQICDIVT